MTKLSRSDAMLAEKTVCVLLVRGEAPDGAAIYAYVGVRADRLEDFMNAQRSGTFYPEEFGAVIESGVGDPTPEVQMRMERDYSFNHTAMMDVPDAENAMRIASELSKQNRDE